MTIPVDLPVCWKVYGPVTSGEEVLMQVTLLYFDGCPHWRTAEARLREALDRLDRPDTSISLQRVTSEAHARALGLRGSPTILVNGRDVFADPGAPVALSCRLYGSASGQDGAPTVAQLVEALR